MNPQLRLLHTGAGGALDRGAGTRGLTYRTRSNHGERRGIHRRPPSCLPKTWLVPRRTCIDACGHTLPDGSIARKIALRCPKGLLHVTRPGPEPPIASAGTESSGCLVEVPSWRIAHHVAFPRSPPRTIFGPCDSFLHSSPTTSHPSNPHTKSLDASTTRSSCLPALAAPPSPAALSAAARAKAPNASRAIAPRGMALVSWVGPTDRILSCLPALPPSHLAYTATARDRGDERTPQVGQSCFGFSCRAVHRPACVKVRPDGGERMPPTARTSRGARRYLCHRRLI
jgi:hypothetical protein